MLPFDLITVQLRSRSLYCRNIVHFRKSKFGRETCVSEKQEPIKIKLIEKDLLHLLENTFDRKRISANPNLTVFSN